jgi:hypothetical protein
LNANESGVPPFSPTTYNTELKEIDLDERFWRNRVGHLVMKGTVDGCQNAGNENERYAFTNIWQVLSPLREHFATPQRGKRYWITRVAPFPFGGD